MTNTRFAAIRSLPLAVEGAGTAAAQGRAAAVGQNEPDTDWQPL